MPASKDILNHRVRLLNLELKDFRGFRFLDLDFGSNKPVTILIADNGGGKTSVLDAVAEFLRYFLTEGILFDKYETSFNTKDITNGEASSLCKIDLELTYPFPAKELFEVCRDVTEYLNEYRLAGNNAIMKVHTEENEVSGKWQLFIDDIEYGIDLPSDIVQHLDDLLEDSNENPKIKSEDIIQVAQKADEVWSANLDLSKSVISKVNYTGKVRIIYHLNKSEGIFKSETPKNNTDIHEFIAKLEQKTAFIEDFCESAQAYRREDKLTVLPLLAYYGCASFNANIGDINILYQADTFQAYKGSLNPSQSDFEEFFAWFNTLREEPAHLRKQVQDAILAILNADQEIYNDLRIKKGTLKIDKQYGGQGSLPLEFSQLSAGEKNIFALIGDLVKRAIQLNPLLFELDYDSNIGTYSNILAHTEGIVLIDEIDLHLHPKWQRMILPKLRKLFPIVQFVVTTHSPFVLQSVEKAQVVVLPSMESWNGLSGWEIYEIIQNAMAETEDTMSNIYQNKIEQFREGILNDIDEDLEESYNWLNKHLHPNNPKRSAIEMQYNVFSKKKDYQ